MSVFDTQKETDVTYLPVITLSLTVLGGKFELLEPVLAPHPSIKIDCSTIHIIRNLPVISSMPVSQITEFSFENALKINYVYYPYH